MRKVLSRSERGSLQIVERGQSEGKEFAEHHTLGQALGRAETEARPEAVETVAHQLLFARSKRGKPVADHDPVGQPAVDQAALTPRMAHHFGIVARTGDFE